jgi:fructokinase
MVGSNKTVAGIELGGTKTVVALGSPDGTVHERCRIATEGPQETFEKAIQWLKKGPAFSAIGVAAFGPLRLNRDAADYGRMLVSPKPGWSGYDLIGRLTDAFPDAPVVIETDVNAALWAETQLGAAQGLKDAAYITVGTGIGAGVLVNGALVHGSLHPEFGHLKVPRSPGDDFVGICPFHRDCLEGMASGPAMAARWGATPDRLPWDHPAWQHEAWYLAHGILALLAIVSPQRVVVGGGVSQITGFHARVAGCLEDIANGYFGDLEMSELVVPPALEQCAGIRGALLLVG